ncbi:helix-turn-helix transcriptional regulator [Prochlorococcus sp. ALOHA_ZT_50]|uniref:helix-turn-helix domain-containing protein n=1 Tax=Prochlorococcus sp. ALOHA_ZT_50 TaxID=2919303 RepID=UPI002579ACF2|nr:helix-turn-helix transcriptional regulator [Prochlorococcus sp. ALOHA_ZT_50]MCH2080689.1 helix-turn-helix domain-containing protein [Prochlorococcus sp. ALOHA_ZT_50]
MVKNEKQRYIEIGKKIRVARENKGFSQKELATVLGFKSSTAISYLETGERKISIFDLENLVKNLGYSFDYFLDKTTYEANNLDEILTDQYQLNLANIDMVKKLIQFLQNNR